MALVKIEDGKKHLDRFNSNGSIIAQSWADALGKKVVQNLYEASTNMSEFLKMMTAFELSFQQVTNLFLNECGSGTTPIDSDTDLIEKLLNEINFLIQHVTDDTSSGSGSTSHYSASHDNEENRKHSDNQFNYDGTMLNGPAVYPQYDFDECESHSVKVRRR